MKRPILAWHFIPDNGHLANNMSHIKAEVGLKVSVNEELQLCLVGLHASRKLIDALKYAPGSKLCRVRLSGEVIKGDDKLVAQTRTILSIVDVERVLHLFACKVAKKALDNKKRRSRIPDPRSYAAIEAKHKYLKGEITKDELSAAYSVARSAAESAYSAAYSVAGSAAESAYSAAYSAACSAAGSADSAAWNAAYSAAYSAAESAACSAAGSADSAAWNATYSAAYSAAKSAHSKLLTKMVLAEMRRQKKVKR